MIKLATYNVKGLVMLCLFFLFILILSDPLTGTSLQLRVKNSWICDWSMNFFFFFNQGEINVFLLGIITVMNSRKYVWICYWFFMVSYFNIYFHSELKWLPAKPLNTFYVCFSLFYQKKLGHFGYWGSIIGPLNCPI